MQLVQRERWNRRERMAPEGASKPFGSPDIPTLVLRELGKLCRF